MYDINIPNMDFVFIFINILAYTAFNDFILARQNIGLLQDAEKFMLKYV